MKAEDWQPLIDAMTHLKNLPQCGDVATELHKIFSEAQHGKYYFIEMGYENVEGKCFVIDQRFDTKINR